MQLKKSPNDINLSELLSVAESTEKTNKAESSKTIEDFIISYNIKPGIELVKLSLLHKLYKYWANEELLLSKFSNTFKNYFDIKDKKIAINYEAVSFSKAIKDKLEEPTNRTKLVKFNHFTKAFEELGIKKGKDAFKTLVLYHMYKNKTKANMPYTFVNFIKTLSNFGFKFKRTSKERFVLINSKALVYTEIELQQAKDWAIEYGKKTFSKKEKKK